MRLPRLSVVPVVLLTALALAGCGSSDKPSAAAGDKPSASETAEPKHVITVSYDEPQTPEQAEAKEILVASGTDGIAEGFSDNFEFPEELAIVATSGEGSPHYDPATKTITLYYDFAALTKKIIQASQPNITDNELGKQWASVNDFILVHELGHAFVDVFDIPITGREEDAVDGMATFFFTDAVEHGPEYAFAAAHFFGALQDFQGEPDLAQFTDEHSLSIQRYADIACKVAGSSGETMEIIQGMGVLPDTRLQRCPAEYEQMSKAWSTLLKPLLREGVVPDDAED